MTPREQLELALVRFADAAMRGEAEEARQAFADAQGLMPVLRSCGLEAADWVSAELEAAEHLAADVEALSVTRQRAAWEAARVEAGAS